jgi:periplasmic protein TonB
LELKVQSKYRKLLIALGATLLLALAAYGIYKMVSESAPVKTKAPKISLIPNTPPPPPPPPKEEKKIDPPKEQKEVKLDQPAPPKEAPAAPASQELKMDGPAGDGPSAFSSGAITRDDLSNLGKGGTPASNGPFNAFKNYATLIKGEMQRHLARTKDLRQLNYRVEVRVWVARDGHMLRHEMIGSTNDPDTDVLIQKTLASLGTFTQPPPEQMPQPIRLLIVTGAR